LSIQGLGAYERWGKLGPGGDPVPLLSTVVPIAPVLMNKQWPAADVAANGNGVNGLGLLEHHPMYEDAAFWRFNWGVSAVSVALVGAFLGAFHGRERSGDKTGPTLMWLLSGMIFPVPTTVVAVAQGFGKRKR
jgi:hypothetical protein